MLNKLRNPDQRHFQYINTIRRPDGTLRPYREYVALSKYEQWCCDAANRPNTNYIIDALKVKDAERSVR